jgi:general L-amino acid transport system substrate-binding protein
MKKAILAVALGVVAASVAATGASAQATLNSVKQRGTLICGSNTGLAGFGLPDAGKLDRTRRGFLPRHRGGDLR